MDIKQALLIGATGYFSEATSSNIPFSDQTKKVIIETLNHKQEKQSDPLVCTTTFKNNPSCNQVEKLSDQAVQKITIQDLEETPFR